MPVRWLSVAGAVAGAVLVWLIAVPVAGVDLVATPMGGSTMHVTLLAVLVSSLVVGLAGLGLLTLLERRSAKGLRNWTSTAAVVLVLSLASPMGGESLGAKLSLTAMHLVVGAVLIAGFRAGAARPSRVAAAAR
ncbi:DUF6069 family protein [Labedaea rhizosphaerae]|uniref:Uncharacterized protein n=1 Tax=Labedaea rhizosphaerae TaxID=598644 RepID=A0A4R6SG49_LABRH|nr:DUF6069 family protein [Labedaea rhizosphaerae]TDQ01002.1 hypothetical protein EV186_102869 [Labedaea rhizosphaerae]